MHILKQYRYMQTYTYDFQTVPCKFQVKLALKGRIQHAEAIIRCYTKPSKSQVQRKASERNAENNFIQVEIKYLLGKSTRDGNRGMNDPGEMNPEKILRNNFSNLHDKGKT